MKTFSKLFLIALSMGASVLNGAGVNVVTVEKELPNKEKQYIHIIGDCHFENLLFERNRKPKLFSGRIALATYKNICDAQKKHLITAIHKLGIKDSLVLVEDPMAGNDAGLNGTNDYSLIQGLCSYFNKKDIVSHGVECRHQNFGFAKTVLGIPLGLMNDEIRTKIDELVLQYNDSPYLNKYYRTTRENLLANNAKVRDLILDTANKLKAFFLSKGNNALEILFKGQDNSSMLEKVFSGDKSGIKTDMLIVAAQLQAFMKEASTEINALLKENILEIITCFKANLALAGLLDVQIMHTIHNSPFVKHIFVCAGAAHAENILPLLQSPEMGYSKVCTTELDSNSDAIKQSAISEEIRKAFQAQSGIIRIAGHYASNIIDQLSSMKSLADIYVKLLSRPLIEEHFDSFAKLRPEAVFSKSRM